MSTVIYGRGRSRNLTWTVRGPRILINPAAGLAVWERSLRTGMQRFMAAVRQDARLAYQDVLSVRDGFATETQVSPAVRGLLLAGADKFPVVEFRTRPHVITARHAPYLMFMGKDGHLVRIKSVNHPGTKGRYAIDRIMDRFAPQFAAILVTAAEAMIDV